MNSILIHNNEVYPKFQNYYESIPRDLKGYKGDEYIDYLSANNIEKQQLNESLDS